MGRQQLSGRDRVAIEEAPQAPIPRPAVAVGTLALAAVAAVACWRLPVPPLVAAAQLTAALVGIGAAAIDARTLRLPNTITYPLAGAGIVSAAAFQAAGLQHGLVAALISGAAYSLMLLALTLLVDVRMYGLGDVKLAAGLGIWLGALSWEHVFVAFIAAQLILLLVVLIDRRLTRRVRMIPAGPAMVAGAILGILTA